MKHEQPWEQKYWQLCGIIVVFVCGFWFWDTNIHIPSYFLHSLHMCKYFLSRFHLITSLELGFSISPLFIRAQHNNERMPYWRWKLCTFFFMHFPVQTNTSSIIHNYFGLRLGLVFSHIFMLIKLNSKLKTGFVSCPMEQECWLQSGRLYSISYYPYLYLSFYLI